LDYEQELRKGVEEVWLGASHREVHMFLEEFNVNRELPAYICDRERYLLQPPIDTQAPKDV
jgi:hypothetical protein